MKEIEKPSLVIDEISPDGRYGKFVWEPLERGYGITLGNSLRRVLLSSLSGMAVTGIKMMVCSMSSPPSRGYGKTSQISF
mgnify:CR=1 FL=1